LLWIAGPYSDGVDDGVDQTSALTPPGPVALVGSGEYLPVLEPVERLLITGRGTRYVQLATAAALEGADSLERWHTLGKEAAVRLGAEQVVVPVVDRDSADDPANAALVEGAGLIYLSGGNPGFLAETLRGTAVWTAIVAAWRAGSALAGCSAGAMALSASLPDVRKPWRPALDGLALVPMVEVLPHFDRFTSWMPDLVIKRVAGAPAGVTVVGIDEDTALVGGITADGVLGWAGTQGRADAAAGVGTTWHVMGRQSAWLLGPDGRREIPAGATVTLG
jgi:cyanophycinase